MTASWRRSALEGFHGRPVPRLCTLGDVSSGAVTPNAVTPIAVTPIAVAHDEAVPGAQAALPRLSAALPSGRLLRALLRGRPRGRAPAADHADVSPKG